MSFNFGNGMFITLEMLSKEVLNRPPCAKVKFIYSEKATKFCEIFTLLLTACTVVKSKVKISQNCVPFSEYMILGTRAELL